MLWLEEASSEKMSGVTTFSLILISYLRYFQYIQEEETRNHLFDYSF